MIARDWENYENAPDVNRKDDWRKASGMFDSLLALNASKTAHLSTLPDILTAAEDNAEATSSYRDTSTASQAEVAGS